MTISWHLETRKIKELREHPKNPRILTKEASEQLKTSMDKFGMIDKPIVNPDGLIIGGHQRIKVLKGMKVKEIECWVPEEALDDRQVDELNIRLNKNTGTWDFEILANQWEPNDLMDWGFTENELLGLDADVEIIESEEDDDGNLRPGEDKDAITKLGDLYELNGHRLVCGDSTLPDVVTKCLGGAEPILMVTDPPYGVEYDPSWRWRDSLGCKAVGVIQNDDKVNWSLAWFLFPGSVAYVWHSGIDSSEVCKSLEDADFQMISQIIWKKQNLCISRGDYHWKHEPCWYVHRKGHKHNWQGARDQTTVWDIANLDACGKSKEEGEERTAHSTQKPIECMARPIKNNTAVGEGVYDPFIGSGTTLIASEQLGRTCYGIELSPAYCDIIVKRWKDWMIKQGKPFTIKVNGKDFVG
jgi:DNA modification methylase